MYYSILLANLLASSTPMPADVERERGFAGALVLCEEWVLNPASWASGTGPLLAKIGLGEKLGKVSSVEEANLPPKELRLSNHFWRINADQMSGYVVAVSDQMPMCHITGGGNADLQSVIESVLSSDEFARRWDKLTAGSNEDMVSSKFRNRIEPSFTIIISRAKQPQARLDRVQVIATAILETSE